MEHPCCVYGRDRFSLSRNPVSCAGSLCRLPIHVAFYRVEQILHMLGNTVVSMRLYSTLYPQSCTVAHTEYEEMLTSYARMLLDLEQKEKHDTYSLHEQKLLLMAVTYRLCSIFSASFQKEGKEMRRKIETFEMLVKLIEENFMRERTVAFYADQLCLTPKYLSVIVKSVCGKTVQQLIFKAIIRRSIYLMKNTNMTIQQIASDLSFPNASSFGTFFKSIPGCRQRITAWGRSNFE